MARITILSLQQKNAALAADNAALIKQVADLQLRLEMAQTRVPRPAIRELSPEAQAIVDAAIRAPQLPARPAYVMPAWQAERAAAMQAAREMAMKAGVCVKV